MKLKFWFFFLLFVSFSFSQDDDTSNVILSDTLNIDSLSIKNENEDSTNSQDDDTSNVILSDTLNIDSLSIKNENEDSTHIEYPKFDIPEFEIFGKQKTNLSRISREQEEVKSNTDLNLYEYHSTESIQTYFDSSLNLKKMSFISDTNFNMFSEIKYGTFDFFNVQFNYENLFPKQKFLLTTKYQQSDNYDVVNSNYFSFNLDLKYQNNNLSNNFFDNAYMNSDFEIFTHSYKFLRFNYPSFKRKYFHTLLNAKLKTENNYNFIFEYNSLNDSLIKENETKLSLETKRNFSFYSKKVISNIKLDFSSFGNSKNIFLLTLNNNSYFFKTDSTLLKLSLDVFLYDDFSKNKTLIDVLMPSFNYEYKFEKQINSNFGFVSNILENSFHKFYKLNPYFDFNTSNIFYTKKKSFYFDINTNQIENFNLGFKISYNLYKDYYSFEYETIRKMWKGILNNIEMFEFEFDGNYKFSNIGNIYTKILYKNSQVPYIYPLEISTFYNCKLEELFKLPIDFTLHNLYLSQRKIENGKKLSDIFIVNSYLTYSYTRNMGFKLEVENLFNHNNYYLENCLMKKRYILFGIFLTL